MMLFEVAPDLEPEPEAIPADLDDPRYRLLWSSAPQKIGKHEWRLIVFAHPTFGACTQFEFRGPQTPRCKPWWAWTGEKHWPRYNHNASDYGLPARTEGLYYRHKATIESILRQYGAD